MGLTYDGITYRSLEEQVRYDAEQVQLLKQADVTINENLQTVNTEVSNKLTKPANPSAESAVTMMADGTVGTKPLSEIGGGGKLYMHKVTFTYDVSGSYYLYIDIPTNTNDDITVDFLRSYIQGYCVVSYDGAMGIGAVALEYTTIGIQIRGVVYDGSGINYVNSHYNNTNGLVISRQTLIEL